MITSLYKLDSKSKMRVWSIELDGTGRYRTITGLVDGKKVTSEWTVAIPTNVGRSNERDSIAQAEFEVNALIEEKRNDNYVDSIDNANVHEKPFEPMLAEKYKSFDKLEGPLWSQPKLDGIRCNAYLKGGKVILMSRNGKEIVAVPHIAKQLEDLFKHEPNIVLDGELYNHHLKNDFNTITSLVRKTKNISAEDYAESERIIEYHVYDMYDLSAPNETFDARRDRLSILCDEFELACPSLRYVWTQPIRTEEDLLKTFATYVELGYEGQMIRLGNSVYEQKRSKNLLKHKPEGIDEEYEIVQVLEGTGNWSGKAKVIECKLNDGRLFNATIKGNMEYLTDVLKNKDYYVGKKATVWCQNLTPDGIPRFPIAKELDRFDV